MVVLAHNKDCIFSIDQEFNSQYLTPIILNLLDKAQNNWDGYNEVYHCCNLIQNIQQDQKMNLDFHTFKKSGYCAGVVLITTGTIDTSLFFKTAISIPKNENAAVLNYFHIAPEGRGNGQKWLTKIIMPYYKAQDITSIYLKSSHPKSFSLYERLGTKVGTYHSISDNGLQKRVGKIFKIIL